MGAALFVLILLTVVFLGIVMYLVGIYNQLVQVKVNVDKSWANIDVLLKQRYDEIPKLIKVCEGYMKYERETLEKITQARTQFLNAKTPGEIAKADSSMAGALKTLFAVSENYPDLKANANFKQLQDRVSYLENQIADRREFYNDSVAIFNTRIKQIPDVFVAGMLNYHDLEMYKVAEAEKQPQDIKFDFPK
jgi:LemA protein